MKLKFYLLIVLLTSLITGASYSQNELTGWGKIYPRDESSSDRSFTEFYVELKNAVENRHKNFIEGIVSQSIELEYDNAAGNNYQSFMSKFNLSDSLNEFWTSAGKILSLGAYSKKFDDSAVFFFPSIWFNDYYNKILGEDFYLGLDINQNYANAVRENVNVYKVADENSEVLGKLNYEIVKINNFEYQKNTPWYKIELKDGIAGYVKNEDLYLSIFDYFMTFKKVNGEWEMVAFERTGV